MRTFSTGANINAIERIPTATDCFRLGNDAVRRFTLLVARDDAELIYGQPSDAVGGHKYAYGNISSHDNYLDTHRPPDSRRVSIVLGNW